MLKSFLIIIFYILFLIFSPLLLLAYLMLYVRARLVALVLSYRNLIFVDGSDALSGIDVATTDDLLQAYILMDGKLDVREVRRAVTARLISPHSHDDGRATYPRLQRYVQLRCGHLVWRDNPHFRIDDHVIEHQGAPPATLEELNAVVSGLINGRFVSDTSGWEFILVHFRFTKESGGGPPDRTCMILRVNHCIMDGVTFVRLFMECLADNSGTYRKTFDRNMAAATRGMSPVVRQLRRLLAAVHAPYVQLRTLMNHDRNALHDSRRSMSRKKLFVSRILSLSDVKAIKNRCGTTVNDVIMSCVAGGLRRYLLRSDGEVADPASNTSLPAHAMVPVHFQQSDQPLTTRNFFAVAVVDLAADHCTALDRLRTTKMIMDRLKTSLDVEANRLVGLALSNVLPKCLVDAYFAMAPMTTCVSNLRGPDSAIQFCNLRVTKVNIVTPHFYSTGVSFGVFSYLDDISVTLTIDSGIINNVEGIRKVMDCFIEEFEELKKNADQAALPESDCLMQNDNSSTIP